MKKIALLATVALASAAVAGTATSPATGYYAGVNVGLANTNVKYSQNAANESAVNNKFGDRSLQYGVFGGYNMGLGNGCVVGAELFAGGDSTKLNQAETTNTATGANYKGQIKRSAYYGVAPRFGYMITPSVLAYIRLGVEGGAWKYNVKSSDTSFTNVSKKKNTLSFAPGIGFDMFTGKNVFVRAQYHHLFGPKLNVASSDGSRFFNNKISQSVFTLAFGYKF